MSSKYMNTRYKWPIPLNNRDKEKLDKRFDKCYKALHPFISLITISFSMKWDGIQIPVNLVPAAAAKQVV